MLAETQDSEEIIARVAALDIGKAELVDALGAEHSVIELQAPCRGYDGSPLSPSVTVGQDSEVTPGSRRAI